MLSRISSILFMHMDPGIFLKKFLQIVECEAGLKSAD